MAPAPASSARSCLATLLRAFILAVSVPAVLPGAAESAPAAAATSVVSAANIPFSAISPGGVDMATGELILVLRPDLVIDGPFPLVYRRYYGSMLAREGLAMGRLGPNWLGSFDWTLSVSGTNATLVTDRGAAVRFTQSPVGSWDLASPTYAKFRLDLVGTMWRITNPLDRRIYFFDGRSWLLTQILDEHGNSLSLSYSGGLLTQVSDGLGRALSFAYDATGLLAQVSDGTRSVHYAYTGGILTGFTDAAGQPWAYGYVDPPEPEAPALLIGVIKPLGNTPLTQAYDPSGRVMSQMDALGGIANYAYDTASGNVFLDPSGNSWTYQHDAQNRLVSVLDPMGGPTSFQYDALGRLSVATRPLGDPTSFAYDPGSGYPSTVTLADGSAFSWGYGSHLAGGATLFDLSTAGYPDGTSESYGRDPSGNLTDFMDRGGLHWTGTYNAWGEILTWANPSGGTTTFTYDSQGRPATGKDNAGNTVQYGYDALSRLMKVTWPDATSRSYAYDALDHLTGLTDERQKLWSYAYDANGRLTSETDPLLEASGWVYDALDRVTQAVDPLGHAVLYSYDPNGRLQTLTDRSGRATHYQYDALGRLTGVVDPAGGTDAFAYDADSRVTSVQDPLQHSTSLVYDLLDRVTHVTDPVGTGFDFSYDSMGRLLSATAPLGHTESFGYDARGLLTSFFDVASETDFPRTPLGEVSQVTDPNRNGWPWSYDPQGRTTGAADPLGRGTSYEYDPLSRVIHIGRPDGSLQQINYDASGRVTGQSYGGGPSFAYGYDDANRLTSATGASFAYDAAGRMTGSNGFAMTYDDAGRMLSETLGAGKAVSYSYDSRGLLSQVMDWMGGTTSFQYDAARRLTGITRPNGTTVAYQYDAADRLISAVEKQPGPNGSPLSSISITRDALGRPTSIDRREPLMPGITSTGTNRFAYDAASQMNGVSHDALGRTTGDASRTFLWDAASRLVHYAAGSDSPSFAYDAFGQVTGATQGNQTVVQAWNYGHYPPTNDDTQVSLPTRYHLRIRTPSGLLLYDVDGSTGARRFYHYDESGNAAYLTNDGGSVVAEYSYGPYGGVAGVGETADNPFTYGAAAGLMSLGSSGLWAAGPQVYDDRTMRVISGNTIESGPVESNPGPVQRPPNPNLGDAWISPGPIGKPPSPNMWDSWTNPGPLQQPPSPNLWGSWTQPGPIQQPPSPNIGGTETGPLNAPMSGPLNAPLSGPLNGPLSGPLNGPMTGPLNSPMPGPVPSPGVAFFKSVSGIGFDASVTDYAQGGVSGSSWTIRNFPSPVPLSPGATVEIVPPWPWHGGSTGLSEIYGNDMVVSLADPQLSPSGPDLVREESGTLLHELGHAFGLDHCGSFDPKRMFTHKYAVFGHGVRVGDHGFDAVAPLPAGIGSAGGGHGGGKVRFRDLEISNEGSTAPCMWCP